MENGSIQDILLHTNLVLLKDDKNLLSEADLILTEKPLSIQFSLSYTTYLIDD